MASSSDTKLKDLNKENGTLTNPKPSPKLKLVKCVVPVADDDEKSTWRLECDGDGVDDTNLKISLVPDCTTFINMLIWKLCIFQIITIFGFPKISSLSSRGAYKFKIPIASWHINPENNKPYFRTPTILVDGEYRIYEIVVECTNYEHTSFDLFHNLYMHSLYKHGAINFFGPLHEDLLSTSQRSNLKFDYEYNLKFSEQLFNIQR